MIKQVPVIIQTAIIFDKFLTGDIIMSTRRATDRRLAQVT